MKKARIGEFVRIKNNFSRKNAWPQMVGAILIVNEVGENIIMGTHSNVFNFTIGHEDYEIIPGLQILDLLNNPLKSHFDDGRSPGM